MKTPMQELIDEMQKSPLMFASALTLVEKMRMLEKEKEVIMDAYDYGFSDAKSNHDHNKRILQRNL
jgi:hypothetical protein